MRTSQIIAFLLLPLSAFAIPLSTSSDNIIPYQRRSIGEPVEPITVNPEAIVVAADKKTPPPPAAAPKTESEAPNSDTGSPGPFPDELSTPPPEVKPGMIQRVKDSWNAGRTNFGAVIAELKDSVAEERYRPVVQTWLDKISAANARSWIRKTEAINVKGDKFEAAQYAENVNFQAAREAARKKFLAAQDAAFAKNADNHAQWQGWVDRLGQKHGTVPPGSPATP